MQPYTGLGKFANYPDDEGGALLRNFGKKLPNHKAPQPTRPGSSTISRGESSAHCFHIVRNPFLTFIFLIYCLEGARIIFYERMTEGFAVFGRSA
jgi:hypothetical protein